MEFYLFSKMRLPGKHDFFRLVDMVHANRAEINAGRIICCRPLPEVFTRTGSFFDPEYLFPERVINNYLYRTCLV